MNLVRLCSLVLFNTAGGKGVGGQKLLPKI